MVLQREPVGSGDGGEAVLERALELVRQREVADLSALRADLMVVVSCQVFGELEADSIHRMDDVAAREELRREIVHFEELRHLADRD